MNKFLAISCNNMLVIHHHAYHDSIPNFEDPKFHEDKGLAALRVPLHQGPEQRQVHLLHPGQLGVRD